MNEEIRVIDASEIENAIAEMFVSVNRVLPDDAVRALENASVCENDPTAKSVLDTLLENLETAKELNVPVCQDTGMAVVFADIGQNVHITGGSFEDAVNRGVARAYTEGYLRLSVVTDPLYDRKNTNDNTPAVIHTRIVEGSSIKLTAAPKGFGSENMSVVRMLNPSATEEDVIAAVTEAVKVAGSRPCPPIIVGVGIGGTFEYAAELSKRALLRPADSRSHDARYAALEDKLLASINELGIGPQGFGGKSTALAVNVEYYPTHIAGLPVAVNICCHVSRHISRVI